jgi:hypothetical protein
MLGEILCGKCSWFGGPDDYASGGVSETEGLAFIFEVSQAPDLFLDGATEALARLLDPAEFYIAMRWDYSEISKEDLLRTICLVRSPETGKSFWARPADWGPGIEERLCDISPGLMEALEVETDQEVEVVVIPPKKSKEEIA